MQGFPENTTVKVEDFRRSGWRAAIASLDREVYFGMSRSLHLTAKAAVEGGNPVEGKLLWLLADACSFRLDPKKRNEPFKSIFSENPVEGCFQAPDLTLFSQIVEEVDNAWLQARLADLVWLLRKPRDPKYALLAIDAYRTLGLDAETWMQGGDHCWHRAINLARSLRSRTEDRLEEMEKSVVIALGSVDEKDGFLGLWISELLSPKTLGKSQSGFVAERLQSLAQIFNRNEELLRARRYFYESSKWYNASGDKEKANEMTLYIVEACIEEAELKKSSEPPNYAAAHSLYESAIKILRNIPPARRGALIIDEIYRQMREAGKRVVEGMKLYKGPSVDIQDMVQDARGNVAGKPVDDALVALATIVPPFRKSVLQEKAQKMLKQKERALFPTIHMAADGRVIAKETDSHEEELLAAMVREYTTYVIIFSQGRILPALEIINLEHRLREVDFVWLADQSPIVPRDRERLVGKGLFLGLEHDFVGALHILVPQVEEMVRSRLRYIGAKTTTFRDSREDENGLGTLVKLPEMVQAFGEDLSFEIEAMFCHRHGPNLRNQLAHGLLGYGACESLASVFAWWFCLRIVLESFWVSQGAADAQAEPKGQEEK